MTVMNRRLGRGRGFIYTSSDARLNVKANATHVLSIVPEAFGSAS
jgi:hypothetical protein